MRRQRDHLIFETRIGGRALVLADDKRREAGPQDPEGDSFQLVINGPSRSFGRAEAQPVTASIGPDFKSAEARGTVSPLFSDERYQIEVRFTCN